MSNEPRGIQGWLLVYLIGSIPLLMVYSMGLSGFFFDYPVGLMVAIFLVLAVPLALLLAKSPQAPKWNITLLWTVAVLMTVRAVAVFLFPMADEGQPPISSEELPGVVLALSAIVSVTLAWAVVWTRYFKRSARVRNTFGRRQPAAAH